MTSKPETTPLAYLERRVSDALRGAPVRDLDEAFIAVRIHIELLRAALDDLRNHGTRMGGGWIAIPGCEWDRIFERTSPAKPKDPANVH